MVMSYIQFESARVKEAKRKENKQAREAILEKVMQLPWFLTWRGNTCIY
jgi:hypothetical protein